MFLRILFLSAFLFLTFPGMASAFQGYVQSFDDNATMSWGSGEIVVTRGLEASEGNNAGLNPLAVRKSASSARKKLLDIIMSVRIDAKRSVSAYLSDDRELAARVRGVVQNSPMERPSAFDGGGEVRVSEQFRGKLAELVMPTTIQFQSGIPPRLATSMEQNLAYNGGVPEEVGGGYSGYTGVVIDARGMNVTPALVPVIYGQDGVGAYGAFLVSRDNAINKGVAAYATTPEQSKLRERVGDRPLVVRALSAYGSWRTDLIITTPMAQLVRAIMRTPEAAENCRLVIVLSPPVVEKDAAGDDGTEDEAPSEEQ